MFKQQYYFRPETATTSVFYAMNLILLVLCNKKIQLVSAGLV